MGLLAKTFCWNLMLYFKCMLSWKKILSCNWQYSLLLVCNYRIHCGNVYRTLRKHKTGEKRQWTSIFKNFKIISSWKSDCSVSAAHLHSERLPTADFLMTREKQYIFKKRSGIRMVALTAVGEKILRVCMYLCACGTLIRSQLSISQPKQSWIIL